ncbi:Antitoxin PemI [Oligella urethralis]|uniref:AbrB/MazE/SpoVT family DNA-binding domain-containing protein n=1 Tax=Oligella urethralis TaxID=90245 RepID=UPI000DFE78B7|nr:AbrB/MazE/SpoVT family DNA-binding domain-containing protein [Oligella urethralis]SUA61588.1 Antitoxin PemI [Oligella urethralis]
MTSVLLKKVGGSTMLPIPPALLKQLNLDSGSEVTINVKDGFFEIKPKTKPKYTLEELLAQSDYSSIEQTEEDKQWLSSAPTGGELL